MNNVMYFEIQADDPQAAMTFYKEIFGWQFTKQEGLPIEYYQIKTEGINGGLLKRPAPVPSGGAGTNAFVCSMEVASYDEISDKIISLGGTIALPKFAIPGKCCQGYFLDTDGNTFGIFQVDEKAA